MMIQVMLFMFGLLGIAAVVIDLGFARLAQGQMQVGTDTAALEGLRLRDEGSELARRQEARLFALKTYEDPVTRILNDGNPANDGGLPPYARLTGAGAKIGLSGGQTPLRALQQISISADPVYRPCLALNQANIVNGDLVGGAYDPSGLKAAAGYQPVTKTDYNRHMTRTEELAAGVPADAFLARMRRTGYTPPGSLDTPDQDDGADVACASTDTTVSAGPSSPLLFGLGSTVRPTIGSGYSVRQHGFTVRATSLARGLPARQIAATYAAPFALERTFWESSVSAASFSLTNRPDGSLVLSASVPEQFAGWVVGTEKLTRVGQTFTAGGIVGTISPALTYYVPIYETVSGTAQVVTGYGWALVSTTAGGGASSVEVTPYRDRMASAGASSQLPSGWSTNPVFAGEVSRRNATLMYSMKSPGLAR
jgi:hypothetical protein